MANKRYEPRTVPNYMGKTRIGKIPDGVGFPKFMEGWTMPDKERKELQKKAGGMTPDEINSEKKILGVTPIKLKGGIILRQLIEAAKDCYYIYATMYGIQVKSEGMFKKEDVMEVFKLNERAFKKLSKR